MLQRLMFSIAFLVSALGAAHAQWVTDTAGGAFDDAPLQIALTANSAGYALGLRCRDAASLEIVYITTEKADSSIKDLNALSPILKFRTDRNEVVEISGDVYDIDGTLAFSGEVDIEIFNSVMAAKSTVSVVLTVLSQNYHENSFRARGSTAAVSKIVKACSLDGD